jgi:hypothetical protein
MNRLVIPLAALLLALSAQTARAQLGRPPVQPFAQPAFSPYLNLARGGTNPGINYFGIVRPQLETQAEIQQLQFAAMGGANVPATGTQTANVVNTGTGSGFQTQGRFFMTAGRPGSRTGGGLTYSNPVLGFWQR